MGHFVTLQDLDWLERELLGRTTAERTMVAGKPSPYRLRPAARERTQRRPERIAVIGGGLIGVEVVEVLLALGHRPTFLVREEWFWPIALDAREAAWIAEALRGHGADVRLGEQPERLLGEDGRLRAIQLASGPTLECDLAVVAIGVVPNTEWLAGSPVELEGGAVRVDDGLATNVPGVYAAGDCAAVPWPDGSRRPEQLWYTARDQGRVAGRRLIGENARYARGVPYNSAKLMDIEYTTVGKVPTAPVAAELEWFHREVGPVKSTTRICLDGGVIAGFNALGRRWNHHLIIQWIDRRLRLEEVLSKLGEAAFDTELVPPLKVPPR